MDLDPAVQLPFQKPLNASAIAYPVHHILTGSFRSISLFLLAFSPLQLTVDLVQTIPAFGPHQYIGLGRSTQGGDVRYAYTTSWTLPPQLQSWAIEQQPEGLRVRFVDSVDITATSSYITVPPPYSHIYSAGGPSAQVHALGTPGFGAHVQEVYFVPQAEWESADKTRKALRYGSHGIEFAFPAGSPPLAFIPVLGGSTIEIYTRAADGSLTHIDTSSAPQRADAVEGEEGEDGPRHVKIHPSGRVLYCVTEHSNYLDVYTISPPDGITPVLTYVASRSLIPPHLRTAGHATYRGDTLLLAPPTPEQPAPQSIFATTRGGEGESTPGWVGVWRLDAAGMFAGEAETNPYFVERYEASTPGGKAHALDVRPKEGDADGAMWVLLTDDSPPHPGVRVLEWDGWLWRGGGTRLREVAAWPLPGFYASETAEEGAPEQIAGASHAVWLD
ncbi:hypothetical protein B0H17DRAFT_1076156 [Mycena rosella]|uniref:Muconate cycloisomerase 1 n=1 Tax=Mycena rosella TaxID=1033263 RepID=A0AAD7D721_MYCRO|nr:hypothetical protein B0H17DRAFT_1076156 [Mycena rosella]